MHRLFGDLPYPFLEQVVAIGKDRVGTRILVGFRKLYHPGHHIFMHDFFILLLR